MKKVAFLVFAAAALTCCKKEKNNSTVADGLVNRWEIRESTGGISGMMTLPAGNDDILEFKSDNSYAYSDKGTIYQSGTYDVQSTSVKDQYQITFHSQQIQDRLWNALVKGDSLLLWKAPECCDIPYNNKYVRILNNH